MIDPGTWSRWSAKFEEGDFAPRSYEHEHQLHPGEAFSFVMVYEGGLLPRTEVKYRYETRIFPGKWRLQLKPDGRLLLVKEDT